MTLRLDTARAGFERSFVDYVNARRDEQADVRDAVTAIIERVKMEGDRAVEDLTRRFDGLEASIDDLRVSADEMALAFKDLSAEARQALELAASRIRAFHERQRPEPKHWVDAQGIGLGLAWTAIDAVGLYVPGGTAAYPSSVLMNAIPAKVAGCSRLVMVAPAPKGNLNQWVLAAAHLAGIDEVYRIGGAQAIAALAYGTSMIRPVDKIVGPGNAFVAEAKRQVFGRVGIDMIAGPSEVVVIADGSCDPSWIAADILAQAEHDTRAQSILLTPNAEYAERVAVEVERQLAELPRKEIARESWEKLGAIIKVVSLDEAIHLSNRLAPEHLQLAVEAPERLLDRVRHAGSVFIGCWTPEVIGDYVGGPNHVLPTGRTARFASGLSTIDFMKRTTFLKCDSQSFSALAVEAATMAHAEGLQGHERAVRIRSAPSGV
ncbi:histidinol dehydrogenase [Arboricoccus pini]|uniref:Histidinol dehydrogenase n=1 Tax=Arboricoccus pini TaxID=1963835 RepID=A0A212R053_9PROT|nr:histidinol dehydrogenase [Arboricoccus pini]SNB65363.1 histidinol dehydrogenase [Arboricoccus pini]